ncbi:SDR family NAD(P)-dependent oxidoreductase [Phytohabitans aurantiacus]|jgi:NAD(P)-dependent dehydrogenase (short-subunit alcohol dehydrogenase family)|uniref:Short-chain dehydrogenase n=1 Tax=Phytohabitans aurantiacus TaxID=3016789 RepID=A0ABQ5R0X7_9ACTN|nr:glucose 1-dehydrogenase [Phytohabitans aurantiacus]GLH99952.1 short-chain dehydrogenase [Phytohabitans aurantiacus]
MSARFNDKTVLVTGGGSGIGRSVALAFAREGAAVVVAGRSTEPLAQAVKQIEADGGRATAVPTDVTRSADVAALVRRTVEAYGRLDVAVNSAGVLTAFGPVADIDEEQWSTIVSVNLTGILLSMKHEIAQMRRDGGGVIVNVSSNLGSHLRVPMLGGYAATKAAVSVLTRTAARDHIGEGIRINSVSPGPTDTPMSYQPGETKSDRDTRLRTQLPVGRVGALSEVAAAVLYLASPEAAFTVGTDLVLDGGATA